jgi:hypothetical protein
MAAMGFEPMPPKRLVSWTNQRKISISTKKSQSKSKECPLVYEERDFSLMPPKLDARMNRRSKDKSVLKAVNAREEALVRIN